MNKPKEFWISESHELPPPVPKVDKDVDDLICDYKPSDDSLRKNWVHVIEKSAAEDRDRTLRCMQQIIKANGSMTYQEFLTNLEGCGMTEDQIGELV